MASWRCQSAVSLIVLNGDVQVTADGVPPEQIAVVAVHHFGLGLPPAVVSGDGRGVDALLASPRPRRRSAAELTGYRGRRGVGPRASVIARLDMMLGRLVWRVASRGPSDAGWRASCTATPPVAVSAKKPGRPNDQIVGPGAS